MNLNCNLKSYNNQSPYASGALHNAVQLCPFVVRVEIHLPPNEFFKDTDLRALTNLENLRHLELTSINVSFHGGILPILEKFGRDSLEVLQLSWLKEVDIAAIVRHCSNLRSIFLYEILQCDGSTDRQPSANAVYQLPHLENLSFFCSHQGSPGEPTSTTLSLLLRSCPSLITLILAGLNCLTDQVIQEAAITHGFRQLKTFNLFLCHNITQSSMDLLLLTLDCPFERISFYGCRQIDQKGDYVSVWREKARENNWDLFVLNFFGGDESSDEDL